MNVSEVVTKLRFEARHLLSPYPRLFLPLMRQRRSHQGKVIDEETEIVIEGYPRSGNTFATAAFEIAQERPVRIARHLHAAAHVIEGVRRGIPVLVVTRQPEDAVVSEVIRHPGLGIRQALRHYRSFHRRLQPYRDRFVVAPFEQLTTDFGAIVGQVNERFGTSFRAFDHTPENVERVFAIIDRMDREDTGRRSSNPASTIARPVPTRETVKQRLREQLESGAFDGALVRARRAHLAFVEDQAESN